MTKSNEKQYFGHKVHYKDWTFDSEKECDFFIRFIEHSGKRFEVHKRYHLVTKFPVGGRNHRGMSYSPDFVIYGRDGSVEHVYDVKSGINQRAVDKAANLRFTIFSLKTGLPVEVVVPRKHDFKMKLFGYTTDFQDEHTRIKRKKNGHKERITEYYNVYKNIDYDINDLIGC